MSAQTSPAPVSPTTNIAAVIDVGSCYLKAGYSGKLIPSLIMPSAVGYTKEVKAEVKEMDFQSLTAAAEEMGEKKPGNETVEDHIKEEQHELVKSFDIAQLAKYTEKKDIKRPVFCGEIDDEDAFVDIIDYTMKRMGFTDTIPLFLPVSTIAPLNSLHRMASVLLEGGLTSSLALIYSAPLSLITANKTTGLAVEASYSHCCMAPVYDGTVAKKALAWNTVCSGMGLEALVYEYSRATIEKQMHTRPVENTTSSIFKTLVFDSFKNYSHQDWARNLVLDLTCQCKDFTIGNNISLQVSTLPDGTEIPGDEPLEVPFPLSDQFITPSHSLSVYSRYFKKTNMILSFGNIFDFMPLLKSVLCPMSEIDIKSLIAGQTGCVVPSGGLMEAVTPLSSSQTTLKITLEELFPSFRSKIISVSRPFCPLGCTACSGASILSSLTSSNILLISKYELAEYGERIIHERLD